MTLTRPQRLKIAFQAGVSITAVDRAYGALPTFPDVYLQVAQAAIALGFPPPPPHNPAAGYAATSLPVEGSAA